MKTIRAIIVEDEKKGMQNLVLKIQNHCPDIEIVKQCFTGEEAIHHIDRLNPDLVFLDIRLGTMSGFDILNRLPQIQFEVVFTTSYDEYAIDAIQVSAIDYLLKPIKPEELKRAVEKVYQKIQTYKSIGKIVVPIQNGFQFIPVLEIMYCQADNNCTKIFRKDNKNVLVTRTLKEVYGKLPQDIFVRTHRSFVVNINFVEEYHRGGSIIMNNGDKIDITRANVSILLDRIAQQHTLNRNEFK